MSNTASSVQAAELSLGIARRGTGRTPAVLPRDTNATWAVGLVVLFAVSMRMLLIWLGPWSDPSRALDVSSAAYIEVAAAFDAGDFLVPAHAESMTGVERMTPVYPSMLAVAQTLAAPTVAVLALQAGLWCAAIYLTYLVGSMLLGNTTSGLVAAGVVALHPAGWLATSTISPESLTVAALMLGVWLAVERRKRDLSSAALGGIAIGVATLALPLSWLLGPAIAMWIAVSDRRLKGVAVAITFGVASLIPGGAWTLRNQASGAGTTAVMESVLPASRSQLADVDRASSAAIGHGVGSVASRLGLPVPEAARGSALTLINRPIAATAAPVFAWGVLGLLVAVGAALGGVVSFLRGRPSAVGLGALLLLAAWASPASEAWRLQAILIVPAALLFAGLFAEGKLVWRRRSREESVTGAAPATAAARDARPL